MTTETNNETAEAVAERGALEATLQDYLATRDAKTVYEKHLADLGADLKAWLEAHPGEVLVDSEHGITAELQDKAAPGRACDLNAMYDNDLRLLEQLIRNGCLKVDETAIKSAGPLVAGIDRYLAPKGRTTSLQVKAAN